MWDSDLSPWLVQVSSVFTLYGINILIHSAIISAIGLSAAFVARKKGAATLSLILRATLVSVLLSCFVSVCFTFSGIRIIHYTIPAISPDIIIKSQKIINNDRSIETNNDRGSFSGVLQNKSASFTDSTPRKIKELDRSTISSPVSGNLTLSPERNQVSSRSTSKKSDIPATILFMILWVSSSVFLFLRLLIHILYINHLRRTAIEAHPSQITVCSIIADTMGEKCPLIFQNPSVKSPFLTGSIHPALFLPLSDDEPAFDNPEVFVHELAHMKRYDQVWNLLRLVGTIVIPLQPLIWILSYLIDETADFVCDDYVIHYTGNHLTYASLLHNLALQYKYGADKVLAGVGFISFKSSLRRRIERILTAPHNRSLTTGTRFLLSLSCCLGCILIVSGFVGVEHQRLSPGTGDLKMTVQRGEITVHDDPFTTPVISLQSASAGETVVHNPGKHNVNGEPIAVGEVGYHQVEDFSDEKASDTSYGSKSSNENTLVFDSLPQDVNSSGTEGQSGPVPAHYAPPEPSETRLLPADTTALVDGGALQSSDIESSLPIPDGREIESNRIPGTDETGERNEQKSPVTSEEVQRYWAQFGAVAATPRKQSVPRLLPVTIPFDYKNYHFDLTNYTERRLYNVYYGLDKRKNEPAWSPDGKWIAFTDNYRIWIVSSQGGAPVLVYEYFVQDFSINNFESLSFTPDSKSIIFKEDTYDVSRGSIIDIKPKGIAQFSNPIPRISFVSITTGEHRVLVEEAYRPGLSHNGRYICFLQWDTDYSAPYYTRQGSRHGLPGIIDLTTGETFFIAVDESKRYGCPSFSPDDSYIVIPIRDGDDPIELFRIPVRGGKPEQLTRYSEQNGYGKYVNFPEYSPDGNWILFTDYSWVSSYPEKKLFVYSIDTGDVFELFEDAPFTSSSGKWSPDGSQLCFILEEDGGNSIYIADFMVDRFRKPVTAQSSNPEGFTLYGNYPNPFNSFTTIDFSLSRRGQTSLVIYNSLGQKVRVLLNEEVLPGRHTAVWDGRNDRGETVSSGAYICHLTSGTGSHTGRMTLLK